jgi:hypothetical protein
MNRAPISQRLGGTRRRNRRRKSPLESVSTSPQLHYASSQSGKLSLSESVFTSPELRRLETVFSIICGRVAESVTPSSSNLFPTPQPYTPDAFSSQSWGHSSIRSGKKSLSESVFASPPPHEPGNDLLESWGLGGTRQCNRKPRRHRNTFLILVSLICPPEALRVLGVSIVTIGNLVAVGVSSIATSPHPHSLFCCRLHLRRPFQWLELFVV